MATSEEAMKAAAWVVNMESGPVRQQLWDGHHSRRIEAWDDGSYRATDHAEADAWLIEQWEASK